MDQYEDEKACQSNYDRLWPPLETAKRDTLRAVCNDLGLSSEAFEMVDHEARDLRDFEIGKKPTLPTPRGRVKTLNQVADLSDALHAAIEDLWYHDNINLNIRLPSEELPSGSPVYNFNKGLRTGHIGSEAKRLAKVAREMVAEIGNAGTSGGRKPTLDYYAHHVKNIFEAVSGMGGMSIGRGGDFERLCSAVFEAAGVHSRPEGAIRHLMRHFSEFSVSPYPPPEETGQ